MAISIIRTIIIFTAIAVAMRIMGKRQLGQLEPSELVVAVLISDLASHPLQDVGTPLLYGLVPVIVLLCAMLKSVRLRHLLCGSPSVIIHNGRIVQSEMRKNRLTIDELQEELRKKDVTDLAAVRYAIVETDGSMSVLLYPEHGPMTPAQMGLHPADGGLPLVLINDGRLIGENLKSLGKDRAWLEQTLRKHGLSGVQGTFLLTVNEQGELYTAPMEAER